MQRREEIKKELWKNKNRLILRAYGEAQDKQDEVFNNFENMLKKVGVPELDPDTISQLKSSLVVAGVYSDDGPILAISDCGKRLLFERL